MNIFTGTQKKSQTTYNQSIEELRRDRPFGSLFLILNS